MEDSSTIPPLRTPVAFLVFNRPALTAQVLAVVRAARPPRLLVVADGPRARHPTDAARCAEVRALLETGVDWPCVVEKNYADDNLGCGRRVASGLDWVFSRVEAAIVLEDDCLPEPTFFRFCEELLERYRDDDRVALIAGCNFQPDGVRRGDAAASYYFSRYLHCWGWASWRRVWTARDHELRAWRDGSARRWLRARHWARGEKRWWRQVLGETARGEIDTWDFQFVLPLMMDGRLGIVAQPNLVTNLGFGPDATHTVAQDGGLSRARHAMEFPLRHPVAVEADWGADEFTRRRQFTLPGPLYRAARFVWHRLRSRFTNRL